MTELRLKVHEDNPATFETDWFCRGIAGTAKIQVDIRQDELRIRVNGKIVATEKSWGTCYPIAELSDSGKDKQIDRLQKENNDLSVKTAQQANLITRQNAEIACLKRNLRHDAEIVQNLHEIMANRLI